MYFLSCFFSKNENLEKKIVVLEFENQKLREELTKLKRSPYFFLGNPINDITQRVMI
jgi:chaperonin cofactor prefoldin